MNQSGQVHSLSSRSQRRRPQPGGRPKAAPAREREANSPESCAIVPFQKKSAGLAERRISSNRQERGMVLRGASAHAGYERKDLYAIAEVGYHYLFSGGTDVAQALFEGLVAVAPNESYFALALGLTHDHLGNPREADRWYAYASKVDPTDGRPDVNRAELYLESGDFATAKKLLARGAEKARNRRDAALEKKASSLLQHLDQV